MIPLYEQQQSKGYVVESGSNANGNYIKFSDGTMICTKKISGNVDITNSWGVLFESSAIDCGKYANEFNKVPEISATATGSGVIIETITGGTEKKYGNLYLLLPMSQENRSYTISLIAIGTWK